MTDRVIALISSLGLSPHPEGGYYGEIYRSSFGVSPEDGRATRPALTTIYFLLPSGALSRWHQVQSDEVWHFYEGAPLDLWMTSRFGGKIEQNRLGPLDGTQRPVLTVPAGWWQAARSTGAYTLTGCTVAPGFAFSDFTLAADQPASAAAVREHHPTLVALL